jgi:hydrogenase maturation protease
MVIVVDAAAPLGRSGRIHRLDLTARPLPAGFSCSSTHALGLAEAVELARSLGRLPRRLIAYVVEGERFDVGAPLSPAVANAVDITAERILTELPTMSASMPPQMKGADGNA